MRKIWLFKVGGLKGCRGYAIVPKHTQFCTQDYSFEAHMGSYCTPNFDPK